MTTDNSHQATDDPEKRFLDALQAPVPEELSGPEMLPTRLARAAAQALPVDGAGLSIHEGAGLRTPVGASDELTSLAERLQFTHGDGPCLRAHDTGQAIAFDLDAIARNWPELHASLIGATPFQAVLSLPLAPPLGPTVVLDLYAGEVARLTQVPREDVAAVVDVLTEELVRASDGEEGPRWWDSPDARSRNSVWQATGLTSVALGLDVVAALAVLRAHAFATGRVVDDVAADLVSGRMDPKALD
ncbi:ANTAR domain-containing protein [Blastococcus sp. URHD0036]|uniref:ANTAR domain-containing protein n=1 Tax=Blastococcus sp. URHD0036 TaxID=1380356 RepID=UPI00068F3BAC|nr:ANTAR domain-containing protein [Blastococcus sp. URHD0036]